MDIKWLLGGAATLFALYATYKGYKKRKEIKAWWNHKENQATVFDKYIKIDYHYLDTPYSVRLPYRPDRVADMVQKSVYAVNHDNDYIDLTQQPGIPYFIKADDMDVDHLIMFDVMEETEHTYTDVPMFG